MSQPRKINVSINSSVELTEYEPGYWLGTIQLMGQDHHLAFMRVFTDQYGFQEAWTPGYGDEDDEEDIAEGVNNNDVRLLQLFDLAGEGCAAFETCKLPGVDGDFVCWVEPFED